MKPGNPVVALFMGLLTCLPVICVSSPLSFSKGSPASPNARDSLKTYYLPTIKVIVAKPSEAIGALHLIDSSDKQSSLNLREMLSQSIGISASSGSKDESNMRLRGFRKNEVKVMIDGRPLNSGYFGNVDLSKLSLLNIAEIQIIKGPASPLYGTNSMGGILNLITKEPSKDTWLQLGGIIKRNNTNELRIGSAHSFDTYSYQLGFAREHTDGFALAADFVPTPFENGGIRNSSAKTQYNLMGSLNADLFTFHKLALDFGYSGMDKKEIPSSIYERRFRFYEDWKRYHATASGEIVLSESLLLSSMLAFDGGGDRYLEYIDPLLQYLNVDSKMQNRSISFAPRLRWQAGNRGIWDWGWRYELQGNKRKDTSDYPDWTDNTVQNTQAFTQYELRAGDNLTITTACGISGSENDLINKLVWNLEPAIGLVFSPNTKVKTSFSAGRNSAAPTLKQLYSYSKGNPYLKPQNAVKLELSHESKLLNNLMNLTSSLFYNDTRDLIDLSQGRYANIYKVQSYGAEAGVGFALLPWWNLETEYAYLDYYKDSDYRLTETPKHTFTITNRLSLPAKSILQLSTHFRGERCSQDDSGSYHNLAPYWRQDLLFSMPWRILKFQLGLENIFDEDYQGEYGFPEAGRNFSLGLEASI